MGALASLIYYSCSQIVWHLTELGTNILGWNAHPPIAPTLYKKLYYCEGPLFIGLPTNLYYVRPLH